MNRINGDSGMQKNWMGTGLKLGVSLGLVAGAVASASAAGLNAYGSEFRGGYPEARAYVGFGFDKPRDMTRPFQYGLRIDHDQRYLSQPLPPIARVEFDRDGFSSAALNGINMVQREYQLDQFGTEVGEVRYSWADWGLLAVGVVGLGFLIYEIADNESDPDPELLPPDDDNGDNGGGLLGGGLLGGGILGGILGGLLGGNSLMPGGSLTATAHATDRLDAEARERQRWLDGGTGYMGDLHSQR
jgi:hypothetical protein